MQCNKVGAPRLEQSLICGVCSLLLHLVAFKCSLDSSEMPVALLQSFMLRCSASELAGIYKKSVRSQRIVHRHSGQEEQLHERGPSIIVMAQCLLWLCRD